MKVKDTTIDHHNDHDFNYQEAKILSNDNGTQEQELGDEHASIPLELNDVIDMVEIGNLLIDVCEAIESIATQDGDINKQRELLEQTEKLSKDMPLEQEYIQDLFYNLVFGHPNNEPHDGEQ